MNVFGPDTLHRTTKLELDEGRAQTVEDAETIASRYVLQIDVGKGITESLTRQAMLLTAVNTASRAFIGGVRVRLPENGPMAVPWAEGQDLATSVKAFGGDLVQSLEKEYPTIVVGDVAEHPSGSVVLFATWEGWSGAIVQDQESRLPERSEFPLAGVLAAALGVSEAFQHVREFALAGRRSVYQKRSSTCGNSRLPVAARLDSPYGSQGDTGEANQPMVNPVCIYRRDSG